MNLDHWRANTTVRILHEEEILGSGFRISPNHIMTCAHVITEPLKGGPITVDFPLMEGHPSSPAEVVEKGWFPVNEDAKAAGPEDIAILRLAEPPQERLVPRFSETETHAQVHMFGFPGRFEHGHWCWGNLKGKDARGWYHGKPEDRDDGVCRGYSGTPAWAGTRVAGMVVAARETGRVPFYVIPTHVLKRAIAHAGLKTRAEGKSGRDDPIWRNEVIERITDILNRSCWKEYLEDLWKSLKGKPFHLSDEDPGDLPGILAKNLVEDTRVDRMILSPAQVLKDRAGRGDTAKAAWKAAGEILEWLITLEVDLAWVAELGAQITTGPGLEIPVRTANAIEIVHSRLLKQRARFSYDPTEQTVKPEGGHLTDVSPKNGQTPLKSWEPAPFLLDLKKLLYSKLLPARQVPQSFGTYENDELDQVLKNRAFLTGAHYLVLKMQEVHIPWTEAAILQLRGEIPNLNVLFLRGGGQEEGVFITSEARLNITLDNFFQFRHEMLGG